MDRPENSPLSSDIQDRRNWSPLRIQIGLLSPQNVRGTDAQNRRYLQDIQRNRLFDQQQTFREMAGAPARTVQSIAPLAKRTWQPAKTEQFRPMARMTSRR